MKKPKHERAAAREKKTRAAGVASCKAFQRPKLSPSMMARLDWIVSGFINSAPRNAARLVRVLAEAGYHIVDVDASDSISGDQLPSPLMLSAEALAALKRPATDGTYLHSVTVTPRKSKAKRKPKRDVGSFKPIKGWPNAPGGKL